MINESNLKDSLIGLYTVLKMQTEQIASAMAEISAVRDSIRALDPTFDDTFAMKREKALQTILPLLSQPIAYIDALTQKIRDGEIC